MLRRSKAIEHLPADVHRRTRTLGQLVSGQCEDNLGLVTGLDSGSDDIGAFEQGPCLEAPLAGAPKLECRDDPRVAGRLDQLRTGLRLLPRQSVRTMPDR